MFAGADVQYVSQNGVLPYIMTQLGILLEMRIQMACFQAKTLQQQQESGCDLDNVFLMGFALKSRKN